MDKPDACTKVTIRKRAGVSGLIVRHPEQCCRPLFDVLNGAGEVIGWRCDLGHVVSLVSPAKATP